MNARKTVTTLALTLGLLAVPGAGSADAQSCGYKLERQFDKRVQMSEVHSWTGVAATFRYAVENSADTSIGIAVQSPGGRWSVQAGGTDTVTRARLFGQTASLRGRGDRRVTGVFKFNVLKLHGSRCPKDAVRRFTRAYRFEGGMRVEKGKGSTAPAGLSGRCNTAPGRRKLYPGTSVFTGTTKSFTYERGVSFFGVAVASSTSFGKNAQIELKNHGAKPVWVCGVNTAGQPVPIAEAAMLYTGPRTKK
jgi:hypothetical protein